MEQQANAAPKRPTFVTVLCILTWVGCGIGLIMNLLGGAVLGAASEIKSRTESVVDAMPTEGMDPAAADAMKQASEAADSAMAAGSTVLIVNIVCILLCLVGSIMMWKLKKVGFYIYTVGELAPVAVSAILLGGSAFGGMMLFAGAIIPIVFVVLYGLNLKHMR